MKTSATPSERDGCPCIVAHERMDDSVAAHQFGNNPAREFAGGSNNEDLWLVQYHKRVLCKFMTREHFNFLWKM